MVLDGFRQLSEDFFVDLLSRRSGQSVRVREVVVTDYAESPDNVRGVRGLSRVNLQTSLGPLALMVKQLSQRRKREALVWPLLEKLGGMPIPEVYHVEADSRLGRFGVIVEYLAPLTETRVWDEPLCRQVGLALARLHAPFWGRAGELPEVIPAPETPPEATVEPAVRRFLDRLPERRQAVLYTDVPAVLALLTRLLRMPPSFYAECAQVPTTLIHGSLKRNEVLFRPKGETPEPVLIDWEHARVGRGPEDVASLVNSLPRAEGRAAREVLVASYADGLALAGVDASADTLSTEIDRQRILLTAKELPRQCGLYMDNKADAGRATWCKTFAAETDGVAAELTKLLKGLDGIEPIPDEESW